MSSRGYYQLKLQPSFFVFCLHHRSSSSYLTFSQMINKSFSRSLPHFPLRKNFFGYDVIKTDKGKGREGDKKMSNFFRWTASLSLLLSVSLSLSPSPLNRRSLLQRGTFLQRSKHNFATIAPITDETSISEKQPLNVVIAGAGVGGLALAKSDHLN